MSLTIVAFSFKLEWMKLIFKQNAATLGSIEKPFWEIYRQSIDKHAMI